MLDAANIAYGALPIRLHVIQDGKVVYEGGPGPMGYNMKDVRRWLDKNLIRCEGKSEWHERSMLKTRGLQWSHKVFANAKTTFSAQSRSSPMATNRCGLSS